MEMEWKQLLERGGFPKIRLSKKLAILFIIEQEAEG
jgi:hypothetical protein